MSTVTEPAQAPPQQAPSPQAPGARAFRPDVQGLRAVAVLLVVLYHAGIPFLPGGFVGVDVFFVISGFLITGHLLREVETTGRIRLARFYARRIRRLLPTAMVVILVTLLVARFFGSVFRVGDVARDALASGFSVMNLRLALSGVDYAQSGAAASPFQHFWSLSVEEQYYLLWPVILLAAVALVRRRPRVAVGVVLVVIGAGSLAYSQHLLAGDTAAAYYSLFSRAWELAVGGGLALGAGRLQRLSPRVAAPLTWLGLAAIVACAVVYDDQTSFPGLAGLWPVLAVAAVVAGGCSAPGGGAERVLGLRVAQGIGTVSYAWYLWHWPVLILTPQIIGGPMTLLESLEMALISLWISVVSYWVIEAQTLRGRLRVRSWATAGAVMALVVGASAQAAVATAPALVGTGQRTAIALDDGVAAEVVHRQVTDALSDASVPGNLTPALTAASDDQPATTDGGCHANFLTVDQGDCVFGDPTGERTMVLLGDSHAQQWFPALDAEAQELGWRLVAWTKAGCPVARQDVYSSVLGRPYTECVAWRERTLERITADPPDVLVISQSDRVTGGDTTRDWTSSTVDTLDELTGAGIPLLYLLDTPAPVGDVPECVATHLDDVGACAQKRADASLNDRHDSMAAAVEAADVTVVDPYDWFCSSDACPAVVGNYLVYRDDSHVSTPYARYLAPVMRPMFVEGG